MSLSERHVQDAPDGARPFDAIAIEGELRNMWSASSSKSSGAIYRAALANLVVPLDPSLASRLMPVLIEVTRRHPSRLFPIGAGGASRGARLEARIGAICHRRETGGGLVCSEQVILDSDVGSTGLIPNAIRSLVIGDLPTVHLNLHSRFDLPWISELMDMADLILVDSCLAAPGAEPEVWRFVGREGSRRVHDLTWARLTPWRTILAEVFDEKMYLPSLRTVRRVEIGFTGPGNPPPQVWLLAGWLVSRLGWNVDGGGRDGLVLRSDAGTVTLALQRIGKGEERWLERIHIEAGAPHPLDVEILHRGRERTARVDVRVPAPSSSDVPFGYREFAACIVGEIQRHAPNRSMEEAARAAEDLIQSWRKP